MSVPPAGAGSAVRPLIRAASQWLVGVTLAVALTLLFLAVSAVQLSSEGTGERLLRRDVAVSTNIDAILPGLQAALREEALASEDEQVRLPGFPIPVDFTREDALTLAGPELRQRILGQAADRLYHKGTSAWAGGDPPGDQRIETISVSGALDHGLGLITSGNHDRIVIATVVLALLSAALAALMVVSVGSWGRLIALSAATIAAALPLLAAAVAVRFAFRTAQEEADPFVSGLLDLGVEAMWVPIRNYLVLTVLGMAVMLLTLVMIWANSRLAARSLDSSPG